MIEFHQIDGIAIAVDVTGPRDGPLAVLLHGFPDSAFTWRHLRPELEGAGYRVAAPYLRGYAPSACAPDGRYHVATLAADALAVAELLGADGRAVLVGHDWGATATYLAAAARPKRFRRIVALAVPPPLALAKTFLQYDQVKRSWYMYFFQSPVATQLIERDPAAFFTRIWRDWSPGYDPADDIARLLQALPDRTRIEAALGYYRSMMGQVAPDPAFAAIEAARRLPAPVPTLYLHGAQDGCLGVALGDDAASVLPAGSRVERIAGAGHFLHLERPDAVNAAILDFLCAHETRA